MLRLNTDPTVRRIQESTTPWHKFTIEGQPLPKQRPRRGKDRKTGKPVWYTPSKTAHYEELVGWSYKQSKGPFYDGYVGMVIAFFRKNRRKVDIDNLVKSCLDGLTNVAWKDDKQVVHLEIWRLLDRDNPRTEVKIWPISKQQWDEMCSYDF